MKHRLPVPVLLALSLLLGACSGVSSLAEERPTLAPGDRLVVQTKSQEAFKEGAWATAWDEAVRAGATRERLEEIAIEAMAPLDFVMTPAAPGTAVEMFDELRAKYGGLTPAARANVVRRRKEYLENQRWTDALELELAAADDPPAYLGARAVYEAAPVYKSTAIFDRIAEAKEEYEAKQAEASAGSDG